MKEPGKPKRKRTAVKLPLMNDGTNTPVPGPNAPVTLTAEEAALFKQAENPLGNPDKV